MKTNRGTVIQVPSATGAGLIFLDGQQISFQIAGIWQSPIAPAINQTVEVSVDDAGDLTRIVVIDAQTLAREKLSQFAGIAGGQSQLAATQGKAAFEILRERMGMPLMIAAAILVLLWFFGTGLNLRFGGVIVKSFSVADTLSFDLNNPTGSFGFWSFLGLLAVLAPWATSWVRARWAPLLFCAPLAIMVLAYARLSWQIYRKVAQSIETAKQFGGSQAAEAAERMAANISSQFAFGFAFWIVFLLSIGFAVIGVMRFKGLPLPSILAKGKSP